MSVEVGGNCRFISTILTRPSRSQSTGLTRSTYWCAMSRRIMVSTPYSFPSKALALCLSRGREVWRVYVFVSSSGSESLNVWRDDRTVDKVLVSPCLIFISWRKRISGQLWRDRNALRQVSFGNGCLSWLVELGFDGLKSVVILAGEGRNGSIPLMFHERGGLFFVVGRAWLSYQHGRGQGRVVPTSSASEEAGLCLLCFEPVYASSISFPITAVVSSC